MLLTTLVLCLRSGSQVCCTSSIQIGCSLLNALPRLMLVVADAVLVCARGVNAGRALRACWGPLIFGVAEILVA